MQVCELRRLDPQSKAVRQRRLDKSRQARRDRSR